MHDPAVELSKHRIVPVIALEDAADAVALARALENGGLPVAEITFRTAAAAEAIRAIRAAFPHFLVGAGTVTSEEQVKAAVAAGASFAVAPGFNPTIVAAAHEAGLPFFPGVMTPGEVERAMALGCTTLKFFPAESAGGVKLLKAIHAPYAHLGVRFVPTGGIEAASLRAYLAEPAVLAVGGSWMVAKKLLAEKNWKEVTRLTADAVAVAKG